MIDGTAVCLEKVGVVLVNGTEVTWWMLGGNAAPTEAIADADGGVALMLGTAERKNIRDS